MVNQPMNNIAQSFQQQMNRPQQQQQMGSYGYLQQQQIYPQYQQMTGYNQNNGYFPYTNPYMNYQQQQQQYMQAANNNQQTTHNNQDIKWVQGEAGAKAQYVLPGTSAMLMDSEENVFYIKTVDANGVPMPLRVFDYVERDVTQNSTTTTKDDNAVASNISVMEEQFVTRDEFKKIIDDFNLMKEQWGHKDESTIQSVEQQQQNAKSAKQFNKHNSTIQSVQA